MLDNKDVEISNLKERLEVEMKEVKLLNSYLMDKTKMVEFFSIPQLEFERKIE